MWIGMIAFWGLLIWLVHALITGATQRTGHPGVTRSSPAATRAGSWTSGWPAGRSTPRSTGG